MLPVESEGYLAIHSSIEGSGIRDPLKCVVAGKNLLVLDGIHRLSVAEALEIPELSYIEVPEEEAVSVVCAALVRAEWSKSALAYRMWPMFAAYACQHGGDRRSTGNDFPLMTAPDIAKMLGISDKLVDQAKAVHAYFEKHPKIRLEQESQILVGALPLHRAGPYAQKAGEKIVAPLQAIQRSLAKLPGSFRSWNEIGKLERERAKNQLAAVLHQLPRDVQETAMEALEVALGR